MKKLLLLSLACVITLNLMNAQTTTFLDPDKDNSIYAEITNRSNGLGSLYTGTNNNSFAARALLFFDIAGSLPANATITQAILRLDLHKRGPAGGSQNFSLHVVNKDWGEGTSLAGTVAGGGGAGAPAIPPDATWTDAMFGTSFWSNPGGDYMATPSATTAVSGIGPYAWFNTNMDNDVQAWYNSPATNFGWILKIDNEGPSGTAAAWGSKDQGVSPVLEITYTTPLSLDDPGLDEVSLYPNPVKKELNISSPANLNINRITILNLLGQRVKQLGTPSGRLNKLDLSELNSGVYLVEISSDLGTAVKRILKE